MANDSSPSEENPVWQEHYRRWSAVNAARERQREAAFAPFEQRQKQFEQHLQSGGRSPKSSLPSSRLTPAQQQQAAGYNNRQKQSLRSGGSARQQQPAKAASSAPNADRQQTQQQEAAKQPADNDEQEQMMRLSRMRSLAQQEQRLARIRRLQQTMNTAQWGFRLSEAGGILTIIGAFGSLLAMNLQLIFGNFFHGQFLLPIPPLSKVEKWATIGADFLAMFMLLLLLMPILIGFVLISKYETLLKFFPDEWIIQLLT